MKKWLKRIGVALAVVIVLAGIVVFDFLRHGGQFRALRPGFAGTCETIPMDASAEDIQIDRERGIAYLSYLDRRGLVEGRPVAGTVMLLDLNAAEPRPRAALASEPPGFRPHGMSLFVPAEGRRRLFVISHPQDQPHEVIVFEETITGAFAPIRTIRDPLLVEPNAIAAVGLNEFYVANDSGASNGFERMQEMLFRRGMSTLAYYDGGQMTAVTTGLKSAAGLAVSPDLTRVYVSETAGNQIGIFRRDVVTGALTALDTIEMTSAPDNLNVATDGTVWVAAHAKLTALIRHFGDADSPAPTQILRFPAGASAQAGLQQVYLDMGEQISAGSVGAVWRDRLLIGSITERKLLDCRLPR